MKHTGKSPLVNAVLLFVVSAVFLGGMVGGDAMAAGGQASDRASGCTAGQVCKGSRFLAGNGSIAAPSYSFVSDTNLGLYRVGADRLGFAADGARGLVFGGGNAASAPFLYGSDDLHYVRLDATGSVLGNNTATLTMSTTKATANVPVASSDTTGLQFQCTGNAVCGLYNSGITAATAGVNAPAFKLQETAALDTGDHIMAVCHGAGCTYDFTVTSGAAAQSHNGLIIGPSGATAISGSYRATIVNPGSCAANTCTDTGIALSSAASGAECMVGVPAVTPNVALSLWCYVSVAGTVQFRCCNHTAGAQTPAAGTYSVRVFNP